LKSSLCQPPFVQRDRSGLAIGRSTTHSVIVRENPQPAFAEASAWRAEHRRSRRGVGGGEGMRKDGQETDRAALGLLSLLI
jgi:hypothetical protein